MTSTRIGIVEDHALLADTVALALRAEGLAVTVADLADRDTVVTSLTPAADMLVLLDLDLGEPIRDGGSLVPLLVARQARVLVVTGTHDRSRVAAAVEAGATGYVFKDAPFDVVLDTVLRAARGECVLGADDRHQLLGELRRRREGLRQAQAPFAALTPRERQVLHELTAGRCVDTIAREWVVSRATVRTQVRGVLTKLQVGSQLAAVAKARAAGWTATPDLP